MLHDLLTTHVFRKPDDAEAYLAYQNLILKGVDKADSVYGDILMRIPVEPIPPQTPVDILRLAKSRPQLQAMVDKVLARYCTFPNTRAGKAALQLQKKR
jgi:hypothetical protein